MLSDNEVTYKGTCPKCGNVENYNLKEFTKSKRNPKCKKCREPMETKKIVYIRK